MGCFGRFWNKIRTGKGERPHEGPAAPAACSGLSTVSSSAAATSQSQDSGTTVRQPGSKSSGSASSARSIPELYEERGASSLQEFGLRELHAATSDFSRLLKVGEGGFGSVYKGVVRLPGGPAGGTVVAIKRLNTSGHQNKRNDGPGYAALKLDMSKAYDRVEWKFLKVKYRIKINGDVTEEIIPQRGLRQGDPLSPYLFLICAEGFSTMLQESENKGRLRANEKNAREVQRILDEYEKCSGQMINREKSSVLFSKNTKKQNKERVKTILKINKEGHSGKYLGLPIYIGKSKSKTFAYLKDKIWKCIQGWKEKLLSRAGKEILIKAVAQAIPVFAMACFDLTKSFCEQISSMICKYWWSQIEYEKGMHWVSWDKMTLPKSEGGLGFRNLYHFNRAMLAKQAWRLLNNPEALCTRVLSAKYFPEGQILEAKPINGMSYTWRSILKGIELLNEGIIWRVGNGSKINIWKDPWIPRGITRRVISRKKKSILNKVQELIDPITNTWDIQLLNQTLEKEDVCEIMQIPIFEHFDDFPAWHYDKKDEDGGHIFFKCKMVKQIWRSLQLEEMREDLSKCPSAMTLVDAIFNMKYDDKMTICCLLWIWWAERNKVNAGNQQKMEAGVL